MEHMDTQDLLQFYTIFSPVMHIILKLMYLVVNEYFSA